MDYSEGYWNSPDARTTAPVLSQDDVDTLVSLMTELRELTQSRRSFAKATDLLQRLGGETQSPSLVPADAVVQ